MDKTIQINGVEVTVRQPYEAGYTINEHEARALNQTRAENIGNNFRKAIKAAVEGAEGAKPLDEILAELAAYDASYEFTARVAGARSTATPLEKMKAKLARNWLVAKLKAQDTTLKAYTEANGEAKVEEILNQVMETPEIEKLAKEELKRQEKTAGALAEIAV